MFYLKGDISNGVLFFDKNNVLNGSICFEEVIFENQPCISLYNLQIRNKNQRKKGNASSLLRKSLILISESGYRTAVLEACPQDNSISFEDLISFYEKFGFKVNEIYFKYSNPIALMTLIYK